jgi:hypothetical protein
MKCKMPEGAEEEKTISSHQGSSFSTVYLIQVLK